jgi:hypothetical protein
MQRTLFSATILAGALAAAISGPADKDRACMKALLILEARMMFVSLGADGTGQSWTQ